MAAYLIANISVNDPEAYSGYTKQVLETVTRWGGRFLVRGGSVEKMDGDWQPNRVVVIEFPDLETAHNWYRSEEYQAILPLRLASTSGGTILVEGHGPD